MRRDGCVHQNLVSSRVCRVDQCEHGTLHLVLGDLTLRVREQDFRELADALNAAASRIAPQREQTFVC